jgi:EAL domain-containing protein (putative c-di-GMP-specific phosphodiesterase class I)
LDLRVELQRALERHQFLLHYQPIIDLRTNEIAAAEALVRWEHPLRGLLAPREFIPAAEESRSILAIDAWVLEEACTTAHWWRSLSGLRRAPRICVNLSGRNFQDANIVDQVQQVLALTDLEPASLELEITESAMILDATDAAQTVLRLKDLGVRVAIDDFGVGYSSLSYLHSFDVQTLKIDRSFISSPRTGSDTWTIVEAIIGLAHALGMQAVAEGVETEEQLRQVAELGCDLAQGYYFHSPMPREEFENLLVSTST